MHRLILLLCLPTLIAGQSLVIVGGNLGDLNAPIWDSVVALAGGKGVARIGIFTTASTDPVGSAEYYIDMFVRVYGAASATHIPITEDSGNADDAALANLVLSQTGFFFGGGDQIRITNALRPNGRDTRVMEAMREAFAAGAVIGGSSAGAACLGLSAMVTGGTSYVGLSFGAVPINDAHIDDLSYEPNGGLGFMKGYVVDTHFSERTREARLIRLLQDTRNISVLGTTRGFGIDEDMALVVTGLPNNPVGKVVGTAGGVFFADVSDIVSTPSTSTDFRYVSTTYLTLDDVIDLTTGTVTFADWKDSLTGDEYYTNAVPSDDILSLRADLQWRDTARRLMDNKNDNIIDNFSRENNPQFRVTFNRNAAVAYGGYYPSDTRFALSYKNLRVDIFGF